jgi:hypothetical protein
MIVALVLAGFAVACGGDGSAAQGAQTVRGLIVEVNARSLLELETLTIEGADGSRWRLEARGRSFGEFTPSHLREHMVQGLPVSASFHREGDVLVLDGIRD